MPDLPKEDTPLVLMNCRWRYGLKFEFMKKFLLFILVLLLALLPAGNFSCGGSAVPLGKIGVIVSILPQQEFVQAIGGDKINVTVMVPPGLDPHTYELKPSQVREVAQSKMYAKLGSGLGFELSYLGSLLSVNKGILICNCADGIQLLTSSDQEEGPGGTDPHIWLSPNDVKIMVQNITRCLASLDPANQAFYEANRDAYITKLTQLDQDIKSGLANVKNRKFMVLHPAWAYFARDYNLEEIAIEVSGKEPSAQDLARLVDAAKQYNIKIIFVSPQFNTRSAEFLAKETGGTTVLIDDLAPNYIENMYYIPGEMKKAME